MKTGVMVLAGCFLLNGCRSGHRPDVAEGFGNKVVRLDGTYGVSAGPELEPVLKVDPVKTGYAFEERTSGEWGLDPETPHVVGEDEVRRALGTTAVGGPVFGLATGRAMLLKVPAGWTGVDGFRTKSGFLLVSAGKLVEARKVELGGR
jgi:hypothetical protein